MHDLIELNIFLEFYIFIKIMYYLNVEKTYNANTRSV